MKELDNSVETMEFISKIAEYSYEDIHLLNYFVRLKDNFYMSDRHHFFNVYETMKKLKKEINIKNDFRLSLFALFCDIEYLPLEEVKERYYKVCSILKKKHNLKKETILKG